MTSPTTATLPASQRHAWTHDQAPTAWDAPVRPPSGAPNMVIILFDDTGFAELGCYGSEIETPNIDRLAAQGLRFTNFHTTTLCSPTRASLLTGRNHHSVGMRNLANVDSGVPSGRGHVRPEAATIAQVLRPRGYATFAVGKWHLAPMAETGPAGPYDHWPLQKGFERFYGFMEGAADHFYPELTLDNHRIPPPSTPAAGYHLTTDLVDHAITMITDRVANDPDKPFLCYLALGATHAPHQAPAEYLARYRGRYDAGWEVIREQRYRRQLEMGIIPPGTELAPGDPSLPRWADMTDAQRRVAARLQEAYAAFLTHTDDQIGRLLGTLDELGLAEDTIVMLLSDNGAAMEGGPYGAVSRIRFFNGLPESDEFNLAHIDTIGGPDGDNHYPKGWAQAGNTPCRWYKYHTHGGGIRDPLIVRWPARITDTGSVRRQFHHVIDLTPTLLDLAGVDLPGAVDGVAQMPLHGVSLAYTFADEHAPSRHRVQHFEMFGNRAIIADGWKAVSRHVEGQHYEDEPWELYHLDTDFSEAHDLAAAEPGRLDELIRLWHVEAGRYDVLPLDERSVRLFQQPAPPTSPFSRRTFTYRAGMTHVHPKACPDIVDRSYTITVEMERGADDDGVLVAHASYWSGYHLAVIDGHLVHDYNMVRERTVTRTPQPLPVGNTIVAVRFRRTGHLRGELDLLVDGQVMATSTLTSTLRFIAMNGLDIGANLHGPVSPSFAPPFPFTGRIRSVRFDLADDQGPK